LLHPFAPFVTEEIWQGRAGEAGRDVALILSSWPDFSDISSESNAREEMEWVIDLITEIRAVRAEMNVPAGAKVPLLHTALSEDSASRLTRHAGLIERLARLERISEEDAPSSDAIQIVVGGETYFMPIGEVIDIDQEKIRLQREIEKVSGEIIKIEKKLSNENFIAKAPEEVVAENRDRLSEEQDSRSKLEMALERLAAL